MQKFIQWVRQKLVDVANLKDKPHSIATGVACGIFFGFAPLFGFKTLLALASAKLLRGNVVAAAIAATLHDITLPLLPMILKWEYQIGFRLLNSSNKMLEKPRFEKLGASMWFDWDVLFHLAFPLILGGIVIGLPFALLAYFLTLRTLARKGKMQHD